MTGIQPIVDWLIDGARSAQAPEDVLLEMCERLSNCGIPLWRVAVFIRTLHPEVIGRRFQWRQDSGVSVRAAPFEFLETTEYQESPIVRLYNTGTAIRRRLADPNCPMDFAVLAELRDEAVTDYLVSPLVFTTGEIHAVSWTTRQPGGFTEAQLAGIDTIIKPFARVAEVRGLRRVAVNLLNTYVGNLAGERILAGQIRRGHTERIHAAVWLSDMRGFTALADRLPAEELIGVLNRYFDCQVPAILAHGGEVLKFMGDGLLAIFPIAGNDGDSGRVCREALTAACEARAKVAGLAAVDPTISAEPLRFGLALHVGEVLYGNIGSGNRLDFTCIGPAVNLAARLEKLAGQLRRIIVASAEFADYAPAELISLGEFSLPGFAALQTAFGLPEDVA
jgi:adenylate cyclase